ncbi:MAG: recombinase family protein [Lachnospiraceae bacterium]|nr:recombinase family protein [Lachnospiraceae bacterium]
MNYAGLKTEKKVYAAAVYLRLSKEDGDVCDENRKQESNSITNQKRLIHDFLKGREDIHVFKEYVDDGYTGSDFLRPSFQEMIKDMEAGKVNLIIVKDLSRFGREYIEAGRYLQKIFPAAGVRFIAVTDHYDSLTADRTEKNIVIPVKNFVNDAYSADLSVKIRSHLESKRGNGEYTGAYVSYGFRKDSSDHNKLVVDPVAGENVKLIFRWKLNGMSNGRIAEKLNALGIPAPADYKRSLGIHYRSGFQKNLCSKWSPAAVGRILSNPLCKGLVVQGKKERINHKIKKMVAKPESEQSRYRQEDLVLIGETQFDIMQELLKKDTRTNPGQDLAYLFSGILYCPDCGRQMIRRKTVHKGKQTIFYICKTYNVEKTCTRHSIKEQELILLVTEAVKAQVQMAAEAKEILKAAEDTVAGLESFSLTDTRLPELEKELMENADMLSGLYADWAEGILSEEEYGEMKAFYSGRCEELEGQIRKRRERAEKTRDAVRETRQWLGSLNDIGSLISGTKGEIQRSLICSLFEKIWVYEGKRVEFSFLYQDRMAEVYSQCGLFRETSQELFYEKGAV